jgi:glycosyltransferase involved in cell wall biosynthesis
MGDPLRVFTWHIHGSYLYYLSQGNYTLYIPVSGQKEEGYYGLGETFPFGSNVIEVPVEQVRHLSFDCILFQTNKNFLKDQYEILSEEQRRLPRIYLEHDPPTKHPTDARHIMDDPDVLMVHVTHYNKLMWWNDSRIVRVIEHGVPASPFRYTGELEKGIVVINHLHQRGRKLGADIFKEVSRRVPLDLIGMGTREYGGLGEVLHPQLLPFISRYRFFFNPIRYTSLGLAVCEAMMAGIPVVALATTEYPAVIRNGESGYIHNDIDDLVCSMDKLLKDKDLAATIGGGGRKEAEKKFDLKRFTQQWEDTFHLAITYNMSGYEENSVHQ